MSTDGDDSVETKIVVGVDFGTTCSALAYVKTTDVGSTAMESSDVSPAETDSQPHDRFLIEEWGPGTPVARKVPTLLKYEDDDRSKPFKWGFHAENEEKKHEWFKLDLYPDLGASDLAQMYPSSTALPAVSGKGCEKLVTDYLKSLRECADNYFRLHGIDNDPDNPTPRQYIITVPALWPEGAQNTTRVCAERAGMGSDIRIISEPEAAGIYALNKMRAIGLNVGDTFVVCDAGGGTVDLVSYTVARLEPPRVYETAKGSGDLCGSSFLNRIFAKHLEDRFQGYGGWDEDYQAEAVKEFETFKQTFLGEDSEIFKLRVRALPDNAALGIRKEWLEIPALVLREQVFKPVIEKVQKLVKDQIEKTPGIIKAILLAGGFGQSDYLKRKLEEAIGSDIKVQKVENSNTAIVRGALIRGLANEMPDLPIFVPEARIARKHYGISCLVAFDSTIHNDVRRRNVIRDDRTGEDLIAIMEWFVLKHTSVQESKPQTFIFYSYDPAGPLPPIDIFVYDDPDDLGPPQYKTDDVFRSMRLTADTQDIPAAALKRVAMRGGRMITRVEFQVEMVLHSANLTFSLVFPGKRYEAVQVDFK